MDSPVLPPEIVAQLDSTDASSLLNTIDGLRALGVAEHVDLPQIIVVGDQSSCKSSVLEAISRVRFPVDGDTCTRFATEIVLRRASETTVHVSIQWAHYKVRQTRAVYAPFQRSRELSRRTSLLPNCSRHTPNRELMTDICWLGAKRWSAGVAPAISESKLRKRKASRHHQGGQGAHGHS